jgi:IMP dehydrogenase/GMP reductase
MERPDMSAEEQAEEVMVNYVEKKVTRALGIVQAMQDRGMRGKTLRDTKEFRDAESWFNFVDGDEE